MRTDKEIPASHSGLALRGPAAFVAEMRERSPIELMQAMADKVEGVASLVPGIPSFSTASHIRDAAKRAIDEGAADRYTSGQGIDALREAIVIKVGRDNHLQVDIKQVVVTHGAVQGILAVLTALVDSGDEVIVLTPDFADHITQVRVAQHGAMPVFVPLRETKKGWILDPSDLEARVTAHTKAVLVCNPCNPTGKVYSYAELKELAKIANRHNLYIISDEMYEYFTYGGSRHISIGSFPEVSDRVISVFGLSKTYSMSGWRIGYVVASEHLIAQIFKIHDASVTCASAAAQYAAVAALRGSQDVVQGYLQAYERRRQLVLEALAGTDVLEVSEPEGAYYAFPRLAAMPIDDYSLALELIRQAKVAVVPGSVFGTGGENHIRISFAGEEDNLREGLARLIAYLEESRRNRG